MRTHTWRGAVDDLHQPDLSIAAASGDSQRRLSSREAANTLIGAIERAGEPWSFRECRDLQSGDLDRVEGRSWPVVLSDGEMLGIVIRDEAGPSEHDELVGVLLRTVGALASAERAAADARRRVAEAEHEARVDSLTGLLNRRAWDNALVAEGARMRRSGGSVAVIVVDIDCLKEANDTDGHLAGDLLIGRTAACLRHTVRDEDIVARLGGDEFGILAVESPTDLNGLVTRIESALREADVHASVGAAMSRAGEPITATVERADRNMYAEKRRRKAAKAG